MDLVQPVIDLLVGLKCKVRAGEKVDPGVLREEILDRLKSLESSMHSIPQLQNKVETVKHVLVYFADEVILNSGWEHAGQWEENLLELELFNSRLGGEQFFTKLDSEGMNHPELAELFFICLSLGFRGKYRIREEPLKGIRETLYSRFQFRLPDDERRLSPGAEMIDPGVNSPLPRMFGLWTIGIVSIVTLGLYLLTSQLIWKEIASVVHQISQSIWT
jgi:type VI secretion system protein ImpK